MNRPDSSGSGKTTISIELTLSNNFCISCAAGDSKIDEVFDSFLESIQYQDYGIQELHAINKSLIFVIDSLDEVALHLHIHKRREIKSLFDRITALNDLAEKYSMSHFPVILIFTVREEYYRDWEESFEGRRQLKVITNKLSTFNEFEFQQAIKKYSETYSYKITNVLSSQTVKILSTPVNLEIFSEASTYEGDILIDDVWEGKILSKYFIKKQEYLDKHHIEGLTKALFMQLISFLAYYIISKKTRFFKPIDFENLIDSNFSIFKGREDYILNLIVSEQIIKKEDYINNLSFRYNRFIDYLVALYIIIDIKKKNILEDIESHISIIHESKIISLHNVLENIKFLTQTDYCEIGLEISNYFQKSNKYLKTRLPNLRGELTRGRKTSSEDIQNLISNSYTQDPSITWDTFFIISAKNNSIDKDTIIDSFLLAWKSNRSNTQWRWKLIIKLQKLHFLIEEKVILILLEDSSYKDWEVFLGAIMENKEQQLLITLCSQLNCLDKINMRFEQNIDDYSQAHYLLNSIINGNESVQFIETTRPNNQYVIFEHKIIDHDLPTDLIKITNNIEHIIDNPEISMPNLVINKLDYNEEELTSLKLELDQIVFRKTGYKTLVRYIINNFIENRKLFLYLVHNQIPINTIEIDQDKKSILYYLAYDFQHSIEHDIFQLLDFVFKNVYNKNADDDAIFLNDKISNSMSNQQIHSYYMVKFYYIVNDYSLRTQIREIEKVINSLLSLKLNKVIGSKFNNLIQVVNNMFQYYQQFGELLLVAIEIYGFTEEFIKIKSFDRKIREYKSANVLQEHKYNKLLHILFPELL